MRQRKEMFKNTRLVLGGQGIQHLEDLRLLCAGIHLAVVPVDRLPRLAGHHHQGKRGTNNGPAELVNILPDQPKCLGRSVGALDNGRNALVAGIVEHGLELVLGGRLLGDLQLKGVAVGLVFRGRLGGADGDALEQIGGLGGSGRAGLVEELDDVERLFLRDSKQLCGAVGGALRRVGCTHKTKHDDGLDWNLWFGSQAVGCCRVGGVRCRCLGTRLTMETFHGDVRIHMWPKLPRPPVRLMPVDPEISTPINCPGKSSLQHAKPQRCQEPPGLP